MSGVVVLRCPSCGTTKAAPGECEACHEAQVRHFCTNHAPGRWLDAPACPDCGARFGDPARSAATPRPAARAPAPAPRAPAPTSGPQRKAGGGPWAWDRGGGSPVAGDAPEPSDAAEIRRTAPRARLPGVLTRAASRMRRTPPGAMTRGPEEIPTAAPAMGGCLVRALFLVVLLLISLFTMSILVGGSLFQSFGIYYW